jgi:SAM-dependent methyltransferase
VSWKDELLEGADVSSAEYRREGEIVGRAQFLDEAPGRMFAGSQYVKRASVAHTTSSVEAQIRRRQLENVSGSLSTEQRALELGCADGLITRYLLEIGFQELVSTDIVRGTVAELAEGISDEQRDRLLLIVDDLLRLPFPDASFTTVIAWGVLSVCGDFEQGLERSWRWLAPGGHLLLAEPLLESVLVYALVRGDLGEFRRVGAEGTRAANWEDRDDRYRVNPYGFYEDRLADLPGATVVERGGVNMLPSLVLGGLAQERGVDESELDELSEIFADPVLDEQNLWRQAFWLVRKK